MIEKIGTGFLIGIGAVVLVALLAVLSGTILFWLWPVAIPAAFPGLVTSGVLAAKLLWWQAVCLTWIFQILIKNTNTTTNSKK